MLLDSKGRGMKTILQTILWLLIVSACALFVGCALLLLTFSPSRAGGAASWGNAIVIYYWWGIAVATATKHNNTVNEPTATLVGEENPIRRWSGNELTRSLASNSHGPPRTTSPAISCKLLPSPTARTHQTNFLNTSLSLPRSPDRAKW